MTSQEIIAAISETHTNLTDILNALEDGEALASLGVTDADQEAVEEAHEDIKERLLNSKVEE